MQKKILVAGGAGFIGSHLCTALVQAGHQVTCLDNFFTGSRDNISHLIGCANFRLLQRDVVQPLRLETNEIYNLACPASPVHYQQNPVRTLETNVLGAINLLKLARQAGARILQASTSEVYGDPQIHPQTEGYWGHVNPVGIRSCYDEGKRCAETLFFDHFRQYKTDIKVVRIFNTYGPRMLPDDGRVVSNFIVQALNNREITVYGDGSHTRSFCYVDDLVAALIKMMASAKGFTGPVNVGNPQEFTIRQLAEKVIEMTHAQSRIVFRPLPDDDPRMRRPDISLAREKLAWEPVIQLEEGLRKTIAYFLLAQQNYFSEEAAE